MLAASQKREELLRGTCHQALSSDTVKEQAAQTLSAYSRVKGRTLLSGACCSPAIQMFTASCHSCRADSAAASLI